MVASLVGYIFQKENLFAAKIENVEIGMVSALFRVGDYIIKIFAPSELDEDFAIH